MRWSRGTRIERAMMDAEYRLDSLLAHNRNKEGCNCVRPLSVAHLQKGLDAVRSAIALIRHDRGIKHLTLFAGSAGKAKPGKRDQKQKPWGSHTAHRWKKDCEDDGHG